MITLQRSIEFHLEEASEFREDLSHINEEKEIKLYYKQCGGKAYVQNRLKFLEWWENLPKDLKQKILAFPLKAFNLNHWFKLTQLSIEQTLEWYNNLFSLLQEHGNLLAKDILNVAKPMFSPKPIKSLKLGEDVTEEGLSLVQEKFKLDNEQIPHIKAKLKSTEENTEDLLALLEDLKLDSLKLLTPKEQLTWQKVQYEATVSRKDAELVQVKATLNEAIAAHKRAQDLVEEQAQIISRQEKVIQQQSEQIQQLLELSQNNKKKSKNDFFTNVEKATSIKSEVPSRQVQYANVL